MDVSKHPLIESRLTIKLVQSLFMPLVYGKTVNTMSTYIYMKAYDSLLSIKESDNIAKRSKTFGSYKYPDIAKGMKLINEAYLLTVGFVRIKK